MYLKYREILDIFMRPIPETEEVFRPDAERFFRACVELFRLKMKPISAKASALPYGY